MHGLIFETSVCYWQNQPGCYLFLCVFFFFFFFSFPPPLLEGRSRKKFQNRKQASKNIATWSSWEQQSQVKMWHIHIFLTTFDLSCQAFNVSTQRKASRANFNVFYYNPNPPRLFLLVHTQWLKYCSALFITWRGENNEITIHKQKKHTHTPKKGVCVCPLCLCVCFFSR